MPARGPVERRIFQDGRTSRGAAAWAWCLAWLVLGTVCFPGNARAQTPPAGTLVTNQAQATYLDPGSGAPAAASSGSVTVVVSAVEGVLVVANQAATLAPGSLASFAHTVTNTGNVATSFTVALVNQAGDDFDLVGLRLVLDANGNGVADPAETVLGNGGSLPLAIGQVLQVLLQGTVPATAMAGDSGIVQLDVTGTQPGVSGSVVDTVQVAAVASLQVTKAASNLTPNPGDTVTFTLSATNQGVGVAGPIPITVDAAAVTRFVLRDFVPIDTSFVDIVSSGAATPLYHVTGAPADVYVSAPPPPATVDEIAFALPSLAPTQSLTVQFRVRIVAAPVGNSVTNVGEARFDDGVNPGVTSVPSNPVVLTLPATSASLAYFQGPAFATPAYVGTVGAPLYIQGTAASCDLNPAAVETLAIQVRSQLTGDLETFTATESGVNTGLFRILPNVPTADAQLVPVAAGNGVLELLVDDTVTASFADCASGLTVQTRLLIDPRGVVFDSRTNQPVAGAQVSLVDVTGAGNGGTPGGAAVVFQADGVTPAPSTVTTGVDGRFQFPLVAPSSYRFRVVAPSGFDFPSAFPPGQQPSSRNVVAGASYGASFAVGPLLGPIVIDLPLDPPQIDVDTGRPGLFVEKEASRDVAELGEFVDYTVRVRNVGTALARGVVVEDRLPAGLRYESGSSRLAGRPLPDPTGGAGPELRFSIGDLAPDETVTLTYRIQIGPGAPTGEAINRAHAEATVGSAASSNVATARIRVTRGVFDHRGFIVGKVFVDRNQNGLQDPGEPGIPGVSLLLEDGTSAVTDAAGQYSFYGVRPRTHALKVDWTTLPVGSQLRATDRRFAGDPESRFVDLKRGELHRADFAEGSGQASVLESVAARRRKLLAQTGELEQIVERELRSRDDEIAASNLRARPASGTIERGAAFAGAPGPAADAPPAATGAPRHARPSLEEVLADARPDVGFVDLRDGDVVPARLEVRVQGPDGAHLVLELDGSTVPEKRIGQRSVAKARGVQAVGYVGVELSAGAHELRLRALDDFGNVRGEAVLGVRVPGPFARLRIEVDPERLVANPARAVPLHLRVLDADGLAVSGSTPVTLETSAGQLRGDDLDAVAPGLQQLVTGGRKTLALVPPAVPGDVLVRATSGPIHSEQRLVFTPELRPLIATGVLEGRIDLGRLGSRLTPATEDDGFEDVLRETGSGLGGRSHARGALFLKGKIRGDALLTLRYDSESDPDERLFRDIEPDRFYPVYGDASERGYDAQSTSRLYVRIDKERSWLLYGDYPSQEPDDAIELGAYRRNLTGFRGHAETGPVEIDAFASQADARQVVREIPGRGLSGPYVVGDRDILRNSESVEVLVRDRDQPSLVLEARTLSRFTDYEFDPITGTIVLREPLASRDGDLNPQVLRVTYELEQGGSDFWVAGATARLRLLESLDVGVRYVDDQNPEEPLSLRSAHARLSLGSSTVIAEVAESVHAEGRGRAHRLDWRHAEGRLDSWAYWAQTEPGFENPSSRYTGGRTEAGLRSSYRISDRTRARADVIHTEDELFGGHRRGAEVALERTVTDWLTAEIALRHVRETQSPADLSTAIGDLDPPLLGEIDAQIGGDPAPELAESVSPLRTTSARARLTAQIPAFRALSLFTEYEQDVNDADARALAVGGELQLPHRTRLYARHELLSSLRSRFSLNGEQERHATVVGIQSDEIYRTSAFSEYRVGDAFAGRDAEAAIGLRNGFEVLPGLRLHTSFERIETLEGPETGDATAATLAVSYTAPESWKATSRFEFRAGERQDTLLTSLGLALRIDDDWSFLGRGLVHQTSFAESLLGDDFLGRLQLGFAYRPHETNRWNALGRYELRREEDAEFGTRRQRWAHVLSFHGDLRLTPRLWTTGRYALKWVDEDSSGLRSRLLTQLLSGRVTYDLGDRWDLGLMTGLLVGDGLRSVEYGLGGEVGYQLATNLWLSAGYNLLGFEDQDLQGSDTTRQGPYLRIRLKFDEDAFGWLSGDER